MACSISAPTLLSCSSSLSSTPPPVPARAVSQVRSHYSCTEPIGAPERERLGGEGTRKPAWKSKGGRRGGTASHPSGSGTAAAEGSADHRRSVESTRTGSNLQGPGALESRGSLRERSITPGALVPCAIARSSADPARRSARSRADDSHSAGAGGTQIRHRDDVDRERDVVTPRRRGTTVRPVHAAVLPSCVSGFSECVCDPEVPRWRELARRLPSVPSSEPLAAH